MTAYRCAVTATPGPQGSKTVGRTKDGRITLRESSAKVAPWRAAVKAAATRARGGGPLLSGPVHVEITFLLPRPVAHLGTGRNEGTLRPRAPRWPATKPDIDKLTRSTLDALTLTWWTDDAQVVSLSVLKRYAAPGTDAGARITAHPMKELP